MSIEQITADDVVISKAVKAVNVLTIPQLITFLKIMSEQYAWSANDLRKSWANEIGEWDGEIGSVFDLAAHSFEKVADDLQKHWEGL